jgi:hypothetical protein
MNPGPKLSDLPTSPGLCATCVHLQLLASRRSAFVRCGLAASDPRFVRYPPLPVLRCPGHERDGTAPQPT